MFHQISFLIKMTKSGFNISTNFAAFVLYLKENKKTNQPILNLYTSQNQMAKKMKLQFLNRILNS
jgi:hypothetical protein